LDDKSLFMEGFAIAPLQDGPASDRFGRKPVVMIGCALFAVAGAGCATAGSLQSLLWWRLVQAGGAGAGMTIVFAIIATCSMGRPRRLADNPGGARVDGRCSVRGCRRRFYGKRSA
jgi:DHA1 family bicyclomycin/chloramphenicol resistance-like MFS transporter